MSGAMQMDEAHRADPAVRGRRAQVERIRAAAAEAVRAALRRHMLLGESVVVAGSAGDVKVLGPEEIRHALTHGEAA